MKQKRFSHRLQEYKVFSSVSSFVNGGDEAKCSSHRLKEYKVFCSVSTIVIVNDKDKAQLLLTLATKIQVFSSMPSIVNSGDEAVRFALRLQEYKCSCSCDATVCDAREIRIACMVNAVLV